MTSSVFIKTHFPDLRWLQWSFRFLKKNWKTDSEFVICCPGDCIELIKPMQDDLGHDIRISPMEQWPGDLGYLHQQFMKMHADLYCKGELITYIDSDVMLAISTDVEKDLCVDGKPIIWHTPYSEIHSPWQRTVSHFLALQPQDEYMRCFPITYKPETLKSCRERIEYIHGCSLEEVIRKCHACSEFNIVGFFARVFQKDLYTWKNTSEMFVHGNENLHWHDRVKQFWSGGDWNESTIHYLKDLYGDTIESSVDTETRRVVKTPVIGQNRLIESILPYIVKGQIAIDVGAHQGLHSVAYANAGALVYAFEPVASSFTALWRSLYPLGGVAMPFAVSDCSGTVGLQEDPNCTEASYIKGDGEIPCVSLDELFSHLFPKKRANICLIKIDTEGFEPKVLKGALNLIKTDRPVVVTECQKATLERNGFTKEDIYGFFTDLDYEVTISTTDPRASLNPVNYFYDVIAMPLKKETK